MARGRMQLTVLPLLTAWDAPGDALVRLSYEDMDEIGVRPGGTVAVTGGRTTAARCAPAVPASGRGRLTAGTPVLLNAYAAEGCRVGVAALDAPEARRVTLAPAGPVPPANARYVAGRLAGMPLCAGDRVLVPYYYALIDQFGNGGGLTFDYRREFQVAATDPAGGAVTAAAGTSFRVAAAGDGSRAVPPAARWAGRRLAADARRLREAIGPALEGRPGGPRGAVLHGDPVRAHLAVLAAAGACGAHLAFVRQHDLGCAEELGRLAGGSAARAGMSGFILGEPRRALGMALERAPSVIAFSTDWLLGGGHDAARGLRAMLDGTCAGARVALVVIAVRPGEVPPGLPGPGFAWIDFGGGAGGRRRAAGAGR